MSIAVFKNYKIEQINVISIYLCSNLKEDIYIKLLKDLDIKKLIYKLIKSLYELKQFVKIWNHTIVKTFLRMRFCFININNSVFYHFTINIIIVLYIDDILLIKCLMKYIYCYKETLKKMYKIKNLKAVIQVLKFNVKRNCKT